MTDDEFVETARYVTLQVLATCRNHSLDADVAAALASAAFAEALAQLHGPFGTVNQLRDLADFLEAQMLNHIDSSQDL